MAAFAQIKNTEPPVSQAKSMVEVTTFIIRSTMSKGSRHALNGGSVSWSKRAKIEHARHATHLVALQSGAEFPFHA
jgi:hypothetical protein